MEGCAHAVSAPNIPAITAAAIFPELFKLDIEDIDSCFSSLLELSLISDSTC
jgi:hypothetical protein